MSTTYDVPPPPGGSGGQPERLRYLGVPDDHDGRVLVDRPSDSTEAIASRAIGATGSVQMLYAEGDHEAALVGMSPEAVWQIQQVLLQAGVAKSVRRGIPDGDTTGPLKRLMEVANRMGTDIFRAAQQMSLEGFGAEVGGGGGGGSGRIAPVYRPPDPATLAQSVKQAVRQTLRRDPTQDELEQLGAELSGFSRQSFDSQVAAAQGASTMDVDPQARFAELIESKYANELQLLDDREQVAQSTQQVNQQMSFVDRVLGGV